MHQFFHGEKQTPNVRLGTSVFFKKLPLVIIHPMGEKSPNLVTLFFSSILAELPVTKSAAWTQ
jgi:hypothetical protein